jgi:release factor glutamine methyltransferase
MRVTTLPGVFPPHSDTWLLLDCVERSGVLDGSRALDLCTGSGAVAVGLAQRGAVTTAVDISRRAVAATRINAIRNGVELRVLRGHLFEPVERESFDLITCNPPYVPDRGGPVKGAARAWRAGSDGRRFVDDLAEGAARSLRSGGRIFIVHSSLIGEDPTSAALTRRGLQVDVVARQRGPLGPLMRAQRDAGRFDPSIDHEELLVFVGSRT